MVGINIKMIERIFIIGKNGYIASRLLNTMDNLEYKNFFYTLPKQTENNKCTFLNLLWPEKFNYKLINKNDIIIFLACITSQNICRNNFKYAYQINVKGTIKFIQEILKNGAKVLFFSSDTVYGNREETVDETSIPNPYGLYAKMKYLVESRFLYEENFKIFRLSYVFSKDDKFTKYLIDCSQNNTTAKIFHPIYRKVIYIMDVIQAILNIIKRWNNFETKILNICGNELLSRKDIAGMFKNYVDSNIKLETAIPDNVFIKERPKIINIKSLYLKKLLNRNPYTIEQAMENEFLKFKEVSYE